MNRCDGNYIYNGPMSDIGWEGEKTGDKGGPKWTWHKNRRPEQHSICNLSGQTVLWSPAGKNSQQMTI